MPLSDYEQRILEEIERQFYQQDPKFARGVATGTLDRKLRRNLRRGVALLVIGALVLFTFFLQPVVFVGVAAFLMMLVGFTIAYQNLRKLGLEQAGQEGSPQSPRSIQRMIGGFEQRLRDMRRRRDS